MPGNMLSDTSLCHRVTFGENGLRSVLQCRWYLYQDLFLAVIKHHDITKNKFKNEELILAYSSRGGLHNGEEGVSTGSWLIAFHHTGSRQSELEVAEVV